MPTPRGPPFGAACETAAMQADVTPEIVGGCSQRQQKRLVRRKRQAVLEQNGPFRPHHGPHEGWKVTELN
jgi:hypothetical protein